MKVSIWRQFSSNHSASFTIVGEFATAEDAHSAAENIGSLLDGIADYYEAHDLRSPKHGELTPVEQEYAVTYDIDWRRSIDWAAGNIASGSEAVIEYENLVFVYLIHDSTGQGPWPLNELLGRLGGKALVSGSADDGYVDDIYVNVDFSFTAPDEATAQRMFKDIEVAFAARWRTLAPWMPYAPAKVEYGDDVHIFSFMRAPESMRESINARFDQSLDRDRERRALQALLDYQRMISQSPDTDAKAVGRLVVDALQSLTGYGYIVTANPDQLTELLPDLVEAVAKEWNLAMAGSGEISRHGLQMSIQNLFFNEMAFGLPGFIEYLKANNCTDISYTFKEEE